MAHLPGTGLDDETGEELTGPSVPAAPSNPFAAGSPSSAGGALTMSATDLQILMQRMAEATQAASAGSRLLFYRQRNSPRTVGCAALPAAGRLPAAARRAGHLRRLAGAALTEGVAAAARPGGRLRARAHGEPAQRRGDLPLPAVAAGGRAAAAAAAGGCAGGAAALPAAGPPRHLPRHISHAHRMAINERENRRLAPEGAAAGAPGAGACGHQPAADDARLAPD